MTMFVEFSLIVEVLSYFMDNPSTHDASLPSDMQSESEFRDYPPEYWTHDADSEDHGRAIGPANVDTDIAPSNAPAKRNRGEGASDSLSEVARLRRWFGMPSDSDSELLDMAAASGRTAGDSSTEAPAAVSDAAPALLVATPAAAPRVEAGSSRRGRALAPASAANKTKSRAHAHAATSPAPRTTAAAASAKSTTRAHASQVGSSKAASIILDDDGGQAEEFDDFDVPNNFWSQEGFWYCKKCHPIEGKINSLMRRKGHGGVENYLGRLQERTSGVAHLMRHWEACQSGVATPQESAAVAQRRLFRKHDMSLTDSQWAYAIAKHRISYAFFDCPIVQGLLNRQTSPSSAHCAKMLVAKMHDSLKIDIKNRVKNRPSLLALDGGTLHKQTLINVMLIPIIVADELITTGNRNPPLFLGSFPTADSTAATIANIISKCAQDVKDTYESTVIGVVTDNASAMVAGAADVEFDEQATTFAELPAASDEPTPDLPLDELRSSGRFFIHMRCTCHMAQLVIGDVFKALPAVEKVFTTVGKMTRQQRLQLAEAPAHCDRGYARGATSCFRNTTPKSTARFRRRSATRRYVLHCKTD